MGTLGMEQYYSLFIEQGFGDKMTALSKLNDNDLKEIGITKMAHRKVILEQIQSNKHYTTNYNNGNYEGYGNTHRQNTMNAVTTNGQFVNDVKGDEDNTLSNDNEDLFMQMDTAMETKGNDIETENDMTHRLSTDLQDEDEDDVDDAMYQKGNGVTIGGDE